MNQIRWSPVHLRSHRTPVIQKRDVVLEGYSPFKASRLDHPVLVEIAEAHAVTPAQVILRWHVEHGVVVIPKSVHRDRIMANFAISGFSLGADETAQIDPTRRLDDTTARRSAQE